ncbi:unnamed protein product [Nesidiocoris tenuis]|uniref:Uncharacterized protein n=1 Tax=Nesidiocoris tenuis TaxID=355587 RepID=A0A6H5HN92_9HEMI|nr:unnamed protein product [Nesidiocoris tenuis]
MLEEILFLQSLWSSRRTSRLSPTSSLQPRRACRSSRRKSATSTWECLRSIVKLLHLYSAHNTYEDSVSPAFLQKMQTRLKELRPNSADNALMMDVHKSLPLEFPFNPSSIRLEDIEIPDILNLPMLKKLCGGTRKPELFHSAHLDSVQFHTKLWFAAQGTCTKRRMSCIGEFRLPCTTTVLQIFFNPGNLAKVYLALWAFLHSGYGLRYFQTLINRLQSKKSKYNPFCFKNLHTEIWKYCVLSKHGLNSRIPGKHRKLHV